MVMDTTLSDPLVGRLLEGRYAVEAFIAHGGMASVYLATDTRLERRVAVKVMHAHLCDDRETVARFEREARAAARLSHPDVVAVYDQGIDNRRPFLVMEYVPGANLRHIVRDRGRLSTAEAVAVMDHVLAALASAHAAGLVHRDVKPENVLVTADGRVKVADFGLARAVSGSTVTTTGSVLMGTAAYLAPEQFEHGTADERSDVYSAGVLFFELLTGSTPFEAENAYALLNRHANEDIPAPSTRASGIPPQIDALVTWATSRDPQQRPANAGELHESLIDVRDRLGLHGSVPPPPIALTSRMTDLPQTVVVAQPASSPDAATATRVMAGGRPPVMPGRVTPDPPKPPWRRRRGIIISAVMAVVVALAAVLGWWFAAGRYKNAPNVIGKSQQAATSQLRAAGLRVRFLDAVYSATIHKGLVAAEANSSHVTKGDTVTLRLSLGGRPHTLPRYAGQTVDAVKADLASINVGIRRTKQVFSSEHKGLVAGTEPAQGATVLEGSKVVLEVSKGQQHVPVPDVVGKTQAEATTILSDKGFHVAPVQRYSSTVANGVVIATHPNADRTPVKGSSITLVVSQGQRLFPVPDVEGEDITQAVKDITNAGFDPNAVQTLPGGPGTVLHQNPTGSQPKGTTIELDYY
jgi:serine/threonine-protein kinase